MKVFKISPIQILSGHLAAIAAVALTTLVLKPFEPYLEIQLITLLYLLPVMVCTVLFGLTPGILAGFCAFLAFNYYFILPYHTFQVHKTQDLITLIIFLIVAIVMSQLIGQARQGMKLAKSREWEATRMYELISTLAGAQDTFHVAQALAAHTLETFHLDCVEIFIPARDEEAELKITFPEECMQEVPMFTHMRLQTARGLEGDMRIWVNRPQLSSEEKRLLETFASQGALSIERIRLAKGENKARVLEESDQLKSSLLNSVSHELRSPLAAIKASISSLRSGAVDWNLAERQELLATVEEETDQLNLLVGNLLDMSRIESGALQPHRRWNSMIEILMGVVTKMRKQLQNHQLEVDFPEDIPLIPTDYVMIEQVFTNLVSNSVKYTPPETAIAIAGRLEGEFVHVKVINHGPAVPQEHLERIFDKFFRVTEADKVTGTGLGLSICKGIVEAHGGKIWAENQMGTFEFHFTLPIRLDGALPEIPKETTDG